MSARPSIQRSIANRGAANLGCGRLLAGVSRVETRQRPELAAPLKPRRSWSALGRRSDERNVFGKDPRPVTRSGGFPFLEPRLQRLFRNFQINHAIRDIQPDDIAL